MVCAGIETLGIIGIVEFLSYPTLCDFQFYAKIMGAIFLVISLLLYFNEKNNDNVQKPDMLSSLGVGATVTIILSMIGTFVGFIQNEIFIEILVGGMVFIAIWFFKR